MFAYSIAAPVNAANEPLLTRQQVWRGLVMKAENALPFVPGMESCRVLNRWRGGLLREAVFQGRYLYEKVTFIEPVQMLFERVGADDWIANTISESEAGLLLTFSFAVKFEGVEPGSDQERARGAAISDSWREALHHTLKTLRERAGSGDL